MKLVTYEYKGTRRSGWIEGDRVIDIAQASRGKLPDTMLELLADYMTYWPVLQKAASERDPSAGGIPLQHVKLCAPLPNPPSIRDFYAFEAHVKKARSRRGLEIVPEWYDFPVFYFTNPRSVIGQGDSVTRPKKCGELDYELEIACVIGKKGRDICIDEADTYIAGYMIMNDWSARDIQREEMKVGLGPAKGKDFATSFGPYLVTKDELAAYRKNKGYDLRMTAKVNGKLLSEGNMSALHYSFAEMIARASEDCTLYPGDILGSGTVGSGCILELGEETHRYLQRGDLVELEITRIGQLVNRVEE